MEETVEHKLANLPPSAKLVFVVLDHEGKLTQKQLVEETRLSYRTVRYALTRLKDSNVIDGEISFRDARQTLYSTTQAPSSTGYP